MLSKKEAFNTERPAKKLLKPLLPKRLLSSQDPSSEQPKRTKYDTVDIEKDLGWSKESNKLLAYWIKYELEPLFLNSTQDLIRKDTYAYYNLKSEWLHLLDKIKRDWLNQSNFIKLKNDLEDLLSEWEFKKQDFRVDYGKRRQLKKLLFFYNKIWLALSLDSILSPKLEEADMPFSLDNAFENWIDECLFNNLNPSASSKELNQKILNHLIQLIFLLESLITIKPTLFKTNLPLFIIDSEIQSNELMLEQLLELFVIKPSQSLMALRAKSWHLKFIQGRKEEVSYSIEELAIDLRDGVKLARLLELSFDKEVKGIDLTPNTFQDKLNNQRSIFNFLNQQGLNPKYFIGGPTYPVDLVNGHRLKTLGLLFTLIQKYKLNQWLNIDFLKSEIAKLKFEYYKLYKTQIDFQSTEKLYFTSPLISGLLTWCATIGQLYGAEVNNFTTSFEDGRVITLIIAHYFPNIIRLDEILIPSSSSNIPPEEPLLESQWYVFTPKVKVEDVKRKAIVHNFDLFKRAVSQLGGLPKFHSFRSLGTFDERLVILFVGLLAFRINQLKIWDSAAKKIQNWWKNYGHFHFENHRQVKLEIKRNLAVKIIINSFKKWINKLDYGHVGNDFLEYKAFVVRVQSLRRSCIKMMEFKAKRLATIKLQSFLKGLYCQKIFNQQKQSAIRIQSLWRSYFARKEFALLKLEFSAAIKIQSVLKCRHIMLSYNLLKEATLLTQLRYRAKQSGQKELGNFNLMKKCAILLQNTYRFKKAKVEHQQLRIKNAVIIQSYLKRVLAIRKFNQLKTEFKAAVILQKILHMNYQREQFLKIKSNAVHLQCLIRSNLVRKDFNLIKQSTKIIQRSYKNYNHMQHVKFDYQRLCSIAKFIQMRRKAMTIGQQTQYQYNKLIRATKIIQNQLRKRWYLLAQQQARLEATIRIQTIFRRYLAIKLLNQLKKEHQASILIQRYIKSYKVRSDYELKIYVANLIQITRREKVKTLKTKSEFEKLKFMIRFVQQRYRFKVYYRNYCDLRNQKAIQLQCWWRMILAKKRLIYLKHMKASTIISSFFKMYHVKKQYDQLKLASYISQSIIRNYRFTKEVSTLYQSILNATIITQTFYKNKCIGLQIKNYFEKVKCAAIILQKYWKGLQARKKLIELREQKAAICIQSFLKMTKVYRNYSNLRTTARKTAYIYQNHKFTKEVHTFYSVYREATITIQQRFQQCQLGKAVKDLYETHKKAAIVIQRAIRAYWIKKDLKLAATIKIQSLFRMLKARRQYLYQKDLYNKAKLIQKILHMNRIQKNYRKQLEVVKGLQIRLRMKKLRNIEFNKFNKIHSAALLSQRVLKASKLALKVKKDYELKYSLALKLQRYARTKAAYNQFEALKNASNTMIKRRKAILLTREIASSYECIKATAQFIQELYRHNVACKEIHVGYQTFINSAIIIQRAIRNLWAKRELKLKSAIQIQAIIKGYLTRKQFLVKLNQHRNVIKIQKIVRMYHIKKNFNLTYRLANLIQERRNALIQSNIQLNEFNNIKLLTLFIQTRLRALNLGNIVYKDYQLKKQVIIQVQNKVKLFLKKREKAATMIQIKWKAYKLRKEAQLILNQKKMIRNTFKKIYFKIISMRQLHLCFQQKAQAQLYYKLRLLKFHIKEWRLVCGDKLEELRQIRLQKKREEASIQLQWLIRGYLARRKYKAQLKIAKNIAALWRGYKVRQRNSPKIQRVRQRILKVNREAQPHMILSNRTTLALEILNSSKSLTQIIKACDHLVVVTQLSHTCRQRLMEQYHVLQVILGLMKSCNRSQPHQEILRYAVLILENLSRDSQCAEHLIIKESYLEAILTTLIAHKEVYHVLASLLVMLLNLTEYKTTLLLMKGMPSIKLRLNSILLNLKRKSIRSNAKEATLKVDKRAIYSVGLKGYSTLEKVDLIKVLDILLAKLNS